jgi:hypothetical protein
MCALAFMRVGARACACAWLRVVLLIQQVTRMSHIVTSFVALLAPRHFSTLSHNRHDFRKNVLERKMRVLIFSTTVV